MYLYLWLVVLAVASSLAQFDHFVCTYVSSHTKIHKYKIGNMVLEGDTLVILYKVYYRANYVHHTLTRHSFK